MFVILLWKNNGMYKEHVTGISDGAYLRGQVREDLPEEATSKLRLEE